MTTALAFAFIAVGFFLGIATCCALALIMEHISEKRQELRKYATTHVLHHGGTMDEALDFIKTHNL